MKELKTIRRVKYRPLNQGYAELVESRLCQDNETLGMSLFIDIKNIGEMEIKSVTINYCGFDEDFQLLFTNTLVENVSIEPNKMATIITDISSLKTASVTVILKELEFKNGEKWKKEKGIFRDEENDISENTSEIPIIDKPMLKKRMFSEKEQKKSAVKDKRMEEKSVWKQEKAEKSKGKMIITIASISLALVLVLGSCINGYMIWSDIKTQRNRLAEANALYESGEYQRADEVFDSIKVGILKGEAEEEYKIAYALNSVKNEDYTGALKQLSFLNGRGDSSTYMRQINAALSGVVATGDRHTVAVRRNGTVLATGDNSKNQCSVQEFSHIIGVAAGAYHTLALNVDGSVVAIGDDEMGQCQVADWKSIIGISAGNSHSVGVMSNGRVVAVGNNEKNQCDTQKWSGIVAITTGDDHTVGLRNDGRVVATGDNSLGQCNVENWENIISISAGEGFTLGVTADGRVLATGDNSKGQCDVSNLSEVMSVATGDFHGLAIIDDGSVKGFGADKDNRTNFASWENLVAGAGGLFHSVGINRDGSVYATGSNENGQCNVLDWTNVGLPKSAMKNTIIE